MKTELRTYTKKEIESSLNILNNRLEDKKLERTELNSEIRAIRENIKYYEALDERQVKISWGDET